MVPCSVLPGRAVLLVEFADDLEIVAERRQRFQGTAQLIISAGAGGAPFACVHAVGNVEERHAHRCTSGGRGQLRRRARGQRAHRNDGLEGWQRQANTKPAQEFPPIHLQLVFHAHLQSAFRRISCRTNFIFLSGSDRRKAATYFFASVNNLSPSPRRIWNGALSMIP